MKCPACNKSRLEADGPLSWCVGCGHAFQTDLTVTADYAGGYADRTYATYPETTAHLRAGYLHGRLPAGLGTGGIILDVGYGNGAFLKVMERCGFAARGLDVHGKDYGITEAPLNTRCVAATFFDSLEHLPDLSILSQLNAQHVFVSIPHRPMWFKSDPDSWKHYKPGEHLHYFSSISLRALLHRFHFIAADETCLEDATRGKLAHAGETFDNIRTFHFRRV